MAIYEGEKQSTDIVNNGTISDDEVVATDVPPGPPSTLLTLQENSVFMFHWKKFTKIYFREKFNGWPIWPIWPTLPYATLFWLKQVSQDYISAGYFIIYIIATYFTR